MLHVTGILILSVQTNRPSLNHIDLQVVRAVLLHAHTGNEQDGFEFLLLGHFGNY